MKEELEKLLEKSYSPYSKFSVSCILVMKDGKKVEGVNVENASYGGSICAERNAITSAITMGYKRGDFKEIHVMCNSKILGTPCFICRQTIVEFFDLEDIVVCYTPYKESKVFKVKDICTYPFDENNLK